MRRLLVGLGVLAILLLIPLAVVLAGARGYLYGIAAAPASAAEAPGTTRLAAASAFGMAATAAGVLAAGKFALLALVWRPLLSMFFFVVVAVFAVLTSVTREVHLWLLFSCTGIGGFAFGTGMAVSKDEGAIRWATDQEWSRDRARGVPRYENSSLGGGTPRDTPTGERTIKECRRAAPEGSRRRNLLAEVACTAGAAAVTLLPWVTLL